MALASMTGFARASGRDEGLGWTWEVKSVNGRGLDARCRLPPGMDALDVVVRRAVSERFRRGSFTVALQTERAAAGAHLRIDRGVLDQLMMLAAELRSEMTDAAPLSIGDLLRLRGVVDLVEEEDADAETRARREARIAETLGEALEALAAARIEEGARIAEMLAGHLAEIETLARAAREAASTHPAMLRRRLEDALAQFNEASPPVSEERVAQEVAILLVKGDVREEIDRLDAHIAAARELIAEGGAVGRRLDFLCQEFNREANTLCSKAGDVALTRIGLDLKATIDRFREQVQNVE